MNLAEIRENERKSHMETYSNVDLYEEGSWLRKPIKTVEEIIPLFSNYEELTVLDLGCGVGRNCISIARHYENIPCTIECVDILELAIEKLEMNAKEYGVASSIKGIVRPIEEYPVDEDKYDLIMAVSALEHIDSRDSFVQKLEELNKGVRDRGIICLVINSNVKEVDKATGEELFPQFEVNLPTEELQTLLKQSFADWEVVKQAVSEQQYDIPREGRISKLSTSVVTFVARKK